MQPKYFLLLFLALTISRFSMGQSCSAPGQTPATAFPVCGTDTFRQTVVPICGVRDIPTPCNDGAGYQDKNPFWYKFTCYAAGTLGFTVTPFNLGDDYDWQLFDITGRNPDDVFTDRSMFISCNWSSRPGATGTNNTTNNGSANCAGPTFPNYNVMPVLQLGHEYLLLISHFTNSQEGYFLSFTGGTANITDPKLPRLASAKANCEGQLVTVKLNKKMKCSSLSASGSDFRLSPSPVTIIGATGGGCSNGFDTDSLILTLSGPLAPGNYTLLAKTGSDNNTLLDNCNRNIPVDDGVPLVVLPVIPTPMDSLKAVACAPQTLRLVFKKPIRCVSIAADGSDFIVTGTSSVTVASAVGVCNNQGLSDIIDVQLLAPIQIAGNFNIILQQGTDGNTIIDECGQQTPAGASLPFITKDTVDADFTYKVTLGCKTDVIDVAHDGRNGVNSWKWLADGAQFSTQQQASISYTVFGVKKINLYVSNGVCKDTAAVTIDLDNELKAGFLSTDIICPNDTTVYRDTSIKHVTSWQWDFGNGITYSGKNPPAQKYPLIEMQRTYPIRLIVKNAAGCADTLTKNIIAVANCYIAVPTGFTPNGDGQNDYLYPLNAYKADNLEFKVYNRFGQLIWQTKDWTKKWDGRVNGELQATQTFVWTLKYIQRDTRKPFNLQGTTVLIR